jgi:hypothetical protein
MESSSERLPYLFLAVSNPQQDLANLEGEAVAVCIALVVPKALGQIDVIPPPRTLTLDELTAPFRAAEYRGRIAIFHFAGHGSPFDLLLEGNAPTGQPLGAPGLAHFLATQPHRLKLVFLNACSTRQQVEALLKVAGVDVVIATSQRIRDDVARQFAEQAAHE